VAVYNVDENLTRVLLSAMRTCFMSCLLVFGLVLGLGLDQTAGLTAGLDYNTGDFWASDACTDVSK